MITVEAIKEDNHNWIKVWCKTCAKILFIEDAALGHLNPQHINLANFEASRHENLHKTHDIYVMEHQVKQD